MLAMKKISLGLSLLMSILLLSNSVHAAGPATTQLLTLQGTINHINTSKNIIVVDDMSFLINKDLEVKTVAGNKGSLSSLYRGKRISMQVELNGQGDVGGTIYKIQMLK